MSEKRKIKYIESRDPRSYSFNSLVKQVLGDLLEEEHPDIILVSGGDGAMLHAIQKYHQHKVPFVGYAAGTLNFLMNFIPNARDLLDHISDKDKKLTLIETTSIQVIVRKANGTEQIIGQAINEVVLGSNVMGYHSFGISSENCAFNNFNIQGTGVCISTDMGSTGYNFNLGGPILPLGSRLWSVVGIVCNRYLNDIIEGQNIVIECMFPKDAVYVFIDGIQKTIKLESGDKVILNHGENIELGFVDKLDFIKKRIDITSRYRKS